MKKLLILLILIGGGVYFFKNGVSGILKSPGADPKNFISDLQSAMQRRLPEKSSERRGCFAPSEESLKALEDVIFQNFNAKTGFAFAEVAYNSGWPNAEKVVTRYFNSISSVAERNRVLEMLKFRDKQTFDIIHTLFNKSNFDRKVLLKRLADFKSPEAAQVIHDALNDKNPAVRAEAEMLVQQSENEPWFKNQVSGKREFANRHTAELLETPLAGN